MCSCEDPATHPVPGNRLRLAEGGGELNALPQFVTTIDGVDIQFVHVKFSSPNAHAADMTHGWPGSIFELLKVVGPLTDPTVLRWTSRRTPDPYMPIAARVRFLRQAAGQSGWGPDRMGRAWDALMQRLGYTRYVSQGGDWGAIGGREANRKPLTPQAELQWWYQFYFATERGRAGYEEYRRDFARLIWQIASPKWRFDDATFDRSAASFDNPDHVSISSTTIAGASVWLKASPPMTALENRLAGGPAIRRAYHHPRRGCERRAPSRSGCLCCEVFRQICAPQPDGRNRHNLPQEAPKAFADAVIDVHAL